MTYTELFKYKHKTYGWIARNNGMMGTDVFQYFNTFTNLYEFTKAGGKPKRDWQNSEYPSMPAARWDL